MKKTLLAILVLSPTLHAAEPLAEWKTAAPAFHQDAIPSASPILLYFGAEWCGFCKQMDRTTLADPSVRMEIATLIHVKLDVDQDVALAKQFEVDGVPAFILVNERGEEVTRSVGASDSVAFLNWLKSGEKQEAALAAAAQKLRGQLRQLTAQAASADPAIQAGVRQQAFALIGRGDPAGQQFAQKYIEALAQSNPAALLDGLALPDLAARIAVANILRAALPNSADFDPWAAAPDRQAALEKLRTQLASPPPH